MTLYSYEKCSVLNVTNIHSFIHSLHINYVFAILATQTVATTGIASENYVLCPTLAKGSK